MSGATESRNGAQEGDAAEPFTLADLLGVIRARRRLILLVTIATVALSALVLSFIPTMWSATAVVMIDVRKNSVADATSVLSSLPTDAASMQNQVQILTSRELAGEVVDREHLLDDPNFNAALAHGSFGAFLSRLNPLHKLNTLAAAGSSSIARERVVDAVLADLSADTVGLSTSIDVNFRAKTGEDAARLANAFADAYVDEQIRTKSDAARKATAWLAARVVQLSNQLQAEETAVEQYKAAHGLTSSVDGTSLTVQQLGTINTQLITAKADLAAKEATYGRVKTLISSGHVAEVSQVVGSPLIVQLRTQQALLIQQEADLASRYGPLHPKLIAVHKQRAELEDKLKEEVDRIAGSLSNDVAVARAQVVSLEDSLRATQQSASTQNVATVKLGALQADAASTRAMYDSFITRLRQLQDQEPIEMSDARVISRAALPLEPAGPHRLLLFGASIPAGFLLGLLAALLAEKFMLPLPAPRSRPEPYNAAPAPQPAPKVAPMVMPAVVAAFNGAEIGAIDDILDRPQTQFAQGIAGLIGKVLAPASGTAPRVLAVTADRPVQGKTAVALAMARAAALSGRRTILIDGDLSRAPSARSLGYGKPGAGLVAALEGRVPLSRCYLKDPRTPLLLLSNMGMPATTASTVLGSPTMARLMAHLRGAADLIVIDAPALDDVAEAHALLQYADTVLLVTPPHAVSTRQAATDAQRLRKLCTAPAALVLAA